MSTYIKLSTLQYPFHEGDLTIDSANSSEYALVQETNCPEYDIDTQMCEWGQPEQINGEWRMTWRVRDLTNSEIEKRKTPKPVEYGNRPCFWDESTLSWILVR